MPNLINISIDDVSPHPKSSINVIDRCYDLIKDFPNIKFSLFIPVAYWRTVKPETTTEIPLQIDLFPEFCNFLKMLPKRNFELCYHGYYHGIPGKSDNDEFQYLNYESAKQKYSAMKDIVKNADLLNDFKPYFRPPAWRISPDAISALQDEGIELFALSPDDYARKTYGKIINEMKNIVYYNCCPPLKALELFPKTEVVYHACEWDKNYLSIEATNNLKFFLANNLDYEFCFLKDLL